MRRLFPALPQPSWSGARLIEALVVYGMALGLGRLIFWGDPTGRWWPLDNAYWMFLPVAWAGVRLGLGGTLALLLLVGLQGAWGTLQGHGFFAKDFLAGTGWGYITYMGILALVGGSLAIYLALLHRQKSDARIAAIAFECQEGIVITDAEGKILRINHAFSILTGYQAREVLGRMPDFLLADAGAQPLLYEPLPWRALQRQEWHRRSSGQRYPVWMTRSPVADGRGVISHYVLTMIDLSDWRAQRAQRAQREQLHRQALVREVHHRIKNNLQGVTGILQGMAQRHPSLCDELTAVTGQVQSMALLHGLQGSDAVEQVRLCELVQSLARSVGALWGVEIALQLPQAQAPCHIAPAEAAPLTLIIHELLVNAIKHGGLAAQDVRLAIVAGPDHTICLDISNPGQWPADAVPGGHYGLELVSALMPQKGANLALQQQGPRALARLSLQPPVLQQPPTPEPGPESMPYIAPLNATPDEAGQT